MKFFGKILRRIKKVFYSYIYPLLLSKGNKKVECPFCGWKGMFFLSLSVERRKNALCPRCGSLERHRLYYLYLKKLIPATKRVKVLHFAPEKILTNLFKSYKNIEYLSVDIDPKNAMKKENITNLSFANNSFDIIFCSHVLEHIEDDLKAMRELYRVLSEEGFAILQVPIKDEFNGKKIDKTYEDFSITSPEERERVFGQKDHVRVYGRDYRDRLENSGFNVLIDKFASSLGDKDIKKYGLIPDSKTPTETEGWIYLCTK